MDWIEPLALLQPEIFYRGIFFSMEHAIKDTKHPQQHTTLERFMPLIKNRLSSQIASKYQYSILSSALDNRYVTREFCFKKGPLDDNRHNGNSQYAIFLNENMLERLER